MIILIFLWCVINQMLGKCLLLGLLDHHLQFLQKILVFGMRALNLISRSKDINSKSNKEQGRLEAVHRQPQPQHRLQFGGGLWQNWGWTLISCKQTFIYFNLDDDSEAAYPKEDLANCERFCQVGVQLWKKLSWWGDSYSNDDFGNKTHVVLLAISFLPHKFSILPYVFSLIQNGEKQQRHCCTDHFQELSLSFSIDSF